MLKYCSFLLLLLSIPAISQHEIVGLPFYDSLEESEKIEVTEMVVFPGCKKIATDDFKNSNRCMAKILNGDLIKEMKSYVDRMDSKGQFKTKTKIVFTVNREGEYTDIKVAEDQPDIEFSNKALIAMKKILNKKAASIPAKAGDSIVNMCFTLPITYKLEKDPEYPVPNARVIATFDNKGQILEVVYNRKKNLFLAYDMTSRKPRLLMSNSDLNKIFSNSPFNNLLLSSGEKGLVTEGKTTGDFFRIYINYNDPDEFEVYKVRNNKEEFFTYANSWELQTDKYLGPLLSRDNIR